MRQVAPLAFALPIALPISLIAACANTSGNTSLQCRPISSDRASRPSGWTGTVFTIVMENHSRADVLSGPDTPFIQSLARQGAVAAGYHDSLVHPSEPNYVWMVAGENFGILNDDDPGPAQHIDSQSHVADQVERAGLTWKAYQEGMGAPCGLESHGEYATKHDPFVYFDDINGWDGTGFARTARCIDHIVDYSQLAADLAANQVPDYVFITPDLLDDMHDGSMAEGDAWLSREVPKILASNAFKNGGVLFLLWDEGGGLPPQDDPPFIVVSPNAKSGYVSNVDYDTSSYLKTVEKIFGVEALPCSSAPAAVQTMKDLFTVPLPD
jgi:phospholipase C